MTRNKVRCRTVRVGQYIQWVVSSTDNTEQEKLINALYLGLTDNDSGHILFRWDKNTVVLGNRVVVIPRPQTIIAQVNQMEVSEKEPERFSF